MIDSGATVVILPDSGDPTQIVLKTVQSLDKAYGADAGRLTLLLLKGDAFATVSIDGTAHAEHLASGWGEALRTVFEDGRLLIDDTFSQIRQRTV